MPLRINTFHLVMGFSRALDLVNPVLAGHHLHVGYLADATARQLGLPPAERETLFIAAMLHDTGAIPLRVSASDLIFERNTELHSRAGWAFLRSCGMLDEAAELVLIHHVPWKETAGLGASARPANIINLADRVEVYLRGCDKAPGQALTELRHHLRQRQPHIFHPLLVQAILSALREPGLASTRLEHAPLEEWLAEVFCEAWLDTAQVIRFSLLFSLIIDSISPFTATHSVGVARIARALLRLHGGGGEDIMFVAGLLHDIGKLGVSSALLEKPGPLSNDEFAAMRRHAELSGKLLGGIPGFETVQAWAVPHHERMDGQGYPYGLQADGLPIQARMVAVADVFTALTEDRPYRPGLPLDEALAVLRTMRGPHLDPDLVDLLTAHATAINEERLSAQAEARRFAEDLHQACDNPELIRNKERLSLV